MRRIITIVIVSFSILISVIGGGITPAPAQIEAQTLENLRIWHSPENTRLVFDVSASTQYKAFVLQGPLRLVVDLEQVNLSVDLPEVQAENRHLSKIRSGQPKPNTLRVVFDLKRSVEIESFVLTPNELYGHRLVIDLTDSDKPTTSNNSPSINTKLDVLLADNVKVTDEEAVSISATPPVTNPDEESKVDSVAKPVVNPVVVKKNTKQATKFVVAIDAGHGGDDPGAIGFRGTREKKLTLSIAQKLQKRINRNPKMNAVLVRTSDYYIKLKERREKARKKLQADVFISIHADAFHKKSANGMSVFALSQRGATSAMASTLAVKENASDLLGGVSLADKDEVLAKVLVDLSMTNTISESVNLGGRVLAQLSKLGRLHSKRVEQANFSVLRSPDMPSILVEAGFITNPDDEKKLRSRKHQSKLAEAIYLAIEDYYAQTPYASRAKYESPDVAQSNRGNNRTNGAGKTSVRETKVKYGRHTVVRGDSLSEIAKRYGISLRELKRLNNIKHNTAMLGVRLKVPVGTTIVPKPKASAAVTAKTVIHTVRNGDSLSRISAKYNVTIKAIKRANNLSRNSLRKGEKLKIPGTTKYSQAKESRHKVTRGDTLSEIAQKYGSTIAKIKKANKLRSSTVQLGQVLVIPN